MDKTGGPAFPRPASEDHRHGSLRDGDDHIEDQEGMTLRDYFAGQALSGMVSAAQSATASRMPDAARICYELADAMLAERAK